MLAVSSSKVLRIQLKRYKRTHTLTHTTHTHSHMHAYMAGKQKSRSTVIRLWIFRHINAKYLQRSQNESNNSNSSSWGVWKKIICTTTLTHTQSDHNGNTNYKLRDRWNVNALRLTYYIYLIKCACHKNTDTHKPEEKHKVNEALNGATTTTAATTQLPLTFNQASKHNANFLHPPTLYK